ncbi:choice-of-anchor I family protein [Corynebacterium phoceense]|uniref:choice-of-anchor I family protein n=1 Tax=Corynebacterium phoceense TaxID=1686286 RepID=UPI00211BBC75|nr:choice-of-anchor I family protein [Corynebacterium phoceense]MCQ9340318.1 choice-of-anchor I family protein [Corynebacterium phoceense]
MAIRRTLALCTLAATTLTVPAIPAQATIVASPIVDSVADASLKVEPLGAYDSGVLGESAAEIVAFHAASKRILAVNAHSGEIDILDASDPAAPHKVGVVSAGGDQEINSVAVRPDGLAVAAVQQADKTQDGEALFFNAATGKELGRVTIGALPDNVHLTADGKFALLANEGEPSNELTAEGTDYVADPTGSVSVIALPSDAAAPTQADVRTAGFEAYDAKYAAGELDPPIRVFGPSDADSKPSTDFEPEYISSVGDTAYASLQEAGAIAIIDIPSATVTDVVPAFIADHSKTPIDPSNKDDKIELRTLPVKGLSMPDSIGAFTAGDETYFATANEGDAREWGDEDGSGVYTDEAEIKDLIEDGKVCEGVELPEGFDDTSFAGNLKVSTASGWNEEKSCFDEFYAYGSRSFSIYDAAGNVVFDSGSDFEEITARLHEQGVLNFNADNEDPEADDRSDNKGPEPEALTIGKVGERTYAFIGAERVGGIFVYDVTDPRNAQYVTYVNNRDFSVGYDDKNYEATKAAGDLGPEGLTFVDKKDSPNGEYLLISGNEVSGTTTVFKVTDLVPADADNDDDDQGDSGSSAASSDAGSSVGTAFGVVAAALAAVLGIVSIVPGAPATLLRLLPAPLRHALNSALGH